MAYLVLVAWLVQSVVGVLLFSGWWRHGRPAAATLWAHVGPVVVALGFWTWFVLSDWVVPAWIAFGIITVCLTFGDMMLVARWRRASGNVSSYLADYRGAAIAVIKGKLPGRVVFHALWSPVVYFSCLAACIMATV